MTLDALKKLKLPDTPGIYRFIDENGAILYVGKATTLKDRVRSYFSNDLIATRGPRLVDMVTKATTVTTESTDSVLEALLLEARLIKKHLPPYNTDGKDDKSYNYVVITDEKFPRVLLIRGRELPQKSVIPVKHTFGPFPHGGQLKEALRIIKKIFPFFDTKHPVDKPKTKTARGKITFNQQIGIYPSEESLPEYHKTIKQIVLLFEGRKKELVRELEREMKRAAKNEEFELAGEARRRLFALQHIQDVSLIKDEYRKPDAGNIRIEAYDVAHLGGTSMVGVMTVVEGGEAEKSQYRKFKINTIKRSNDPGALTEILSRRLNHTEWPLPKIIIVDGAKAQLNAAEKVLAEYGYKIPVIGVVKDEHHRPKRFIGPKALTALYESDIILANAEAHRFAIGYHRQKRGKRFV